MGLGTRGGGEYLERTFSDGEIIFREGDESREMYIIRDGAVAISRRVNGNEIELVRRERGEFIGEMALLESLPRIGTARAVGVTRLVVLHSGNFLHKLRRDPAFAFEMMQALSRRFRALNDQVVQILSGFESDDPRLSSLSNLIDVGSADDKENR